MARLAAFDMDGTLLMPDHRLGEKTLKTLKRLREREVTLTFATGRHVLEMRHLLGTFALDAFLIHRQRNAHSLRRRRCAAPSGSESGGGGHCPAQHLGYAGQRACF